MTETHCRLSKAILFQASRYSSESGQDRFKFSQEQAVKLRLTYSNECISVSIAHMATKRCPLHFTSDVMCTANLLVCTMSTPVSVKPSEIAVLHIHA